MATFRIQDEELSATLDPRVGNGFRVQSSPRPYDVEFVTEQSPRETVEALILAASHPLILIDRKVLDLYFADSTIVTATPMLVVDATEDFKQIEGSLEVCEFLERERATKTSTLLVVGGGIVQDVGGFAASIYKRGIPWIYLPTTLLAQGDSSIGGKTGLNHRSTKNLLAIFSAPRRVVIHSGFLPTLSSEDMQSGLGEIFRLHVTGGVDFLAEYEAKFPRYQAGDVSVVPELLVSALSAKRAIIERDEFELDLRRCMNYGHSTGHAFEVLADYAIPHGIAVAVGMLLENQIAMRRGILERQDHQRLLRGVRPLVPRRVLDLLRTLDLERVVDLLSRDKKTEGKTLKLIVLEHVGQIRFIDLPLEPETQALIREALDAVLEELQPSAMAEA